MIMIRGPGGQRDSASELCDNVALSRTSSRERVFMNAIWSLYFRASTLRCGPEDMPYSLPLLRMTLVLWLLLQALGAVLQTRFSVPQSLMAQVWLLAVLLGATWLLLAFKGLSGRVVQTFTALLGVELVIGALALPLVMAARPLGDDALPLWLQVPYLVLLCWNLGARGYILHRALQIGPFLAMALVLTLLMVSFALLAMLMPELAAGAS